MADYTRSPEWGGTGGVSFDDSTSWSSSCGQISRITIRATQYEIAGIGFTYQSGLRLYHGSATDGTETVFDLAADETITSVYGKASSNLVHQIQFGTSKNRTLGPVGPTKGSTLAFSASGMVMRYMFGRSATRIDRLGFTFGLPVTALTATAERSTLHGGAGGGPFDDLESNTTLSRIVSVKVRHGDFINGIGLVYEDGRPEQWRGGHEGTLSIFRVPAGEDLIGADGASGNVVDRLRFYTTNTASPEFGGRGGTPWSERPAGKVIIGLTGSAGANLDKIGFIFLDKSRVPVSAEIIHVDFLPSTSQINEPEFCSSFTGQNPNNSGLKVVGSYEYQVQEQKKVSLALQFGSSVTVSAEVSYGGDTSPISAKLGVSVETSFSRCDTVEKTVSTTRTMSGQVEVEIPPKSRITTKWLVQRGQYTVPYNAIVELTYPDGSKEQKPSSGTFTGVSAMNFLAVADPAQPL